MKNETTFIKMHGLGNDFIIIDSRKKTFNASSLQIKKISDRNFGIGCDQLIVIEKSKKADCFMRIYNQDGGEVSSCGNASRCVAYLIANEKERTKVTIETKAGILDCSVKGRKISVNMGKPIFDWKKIPLSKNTKSINLHGLTNGFAVSMGNPHVVFFVEDAFDHELEVIGPKIEKDKLFPQKTNVEIAQVDSDKVGKKDRILLRVWERGAGITLACGTGACATLVAAASQGFTGRRAIIELPGGELDIHWNSDDNVVMTGEVSDVFTGSFLLQDFK